MNCPHPQKFRVIFLAKADFRGIWEKMGVLSLSKAPGFVLPFLDSYKIVSIFGREHRKMPAAGPAAPVFSGQNTYSVLFSQPRVRRDLFLSADAQPTGRVEDRVSLRCRALLWAPRKTPSGFGRLRKGSHMGGRYAKAYRPPFARFRRHRAVRNKSTHSKSTHTLVLCL